MDERESRETRRQIIEDDDGREVIHEEHTEKQENSPIDSPHAINPHDNLTSEPKTYTSEPNAYNAEPKSYTTEVVYRKSVVTSQSVFWAVFLICFGGFWLMYNFGVATFRFGKIVDYWPILLILWGISFLRVPLWIKVILSAGAAVLLALLLIALIFGTAKFSFFGLR